jgi:hypothetical protein
VHPAKHTIGVKAKDQGFYTDKGEYLDREQVWEHVKEVGQDLTEVAGTGPLFSEDLW